MNVLSLAQIVYVVYGILQWLTVELSDGALPMLLADRLIGCSMLSVNGNCKARLISDSGSRSSTSPGNSRSSVLRGLGEQRVTTSELIVQVIEVDWGCLS